MSALRYLFILLWMVTEFEFVWTFDTVTVVGVGLNLSDKRLSCWVCKHTEERPNPNCVTMMNKTVIAKSKCRPHESFCQIKKRTSNSHVEYFERSCAQHCDTVCQHLKTLKQCKWCCTQSYCNAGSHGKRLQAGSCIYFAISLFAFSFLRVHFERF